MNALVDATPTSVPAACQERRRVWRTIELVATLQIASVCAWPSDFACFSAASVSAVSPGLRHDDDQRLRVRHAVAVAVLARDLDGAGNAGERLDPLLGDEARVVAGAAREDQHRVELSCSNASARVAEEAGVDRSSTSQRIGDRARLLEDLLLHEVPIRSQLDGAPPSRARRRLRARRAGPARRGSRRLRAARRRRRLLRGRRRAA